VGQRANSEESSAPLRQKRWEWALGQPGGGRTKTGGKRNRSRTALECQKKVKKERIAGTEGIKRKGGGTKGKGGGSKTW